MPEADSAPRRSHEDVAAESRAAWAAEDEAAARRGAGEAAVGSAGCFGDERLLLFPQRLMNVPILQARRSACANFQ